MGKTPDVPAADFPYGWGKALDSTHTDIVIPAENKLNVKEFVGEYRIYHKHKDTKGTPVLTILINIHTEDKTNRYFQRALDEWQKFFDKYEDACHNNQLKGRRLHGNVGIFYGHAGGNSTRDEPTASQKIPSHQYICHRAQAFPYNESESVNSKSKRVRWKPCNDKYINLGIYLYGYYGSLTEPPFYPMLEFRVMDTTMLVSRAQLHQIKQLIFNHVNTSTCKATSNQYNGKAARQIESSNQWYVHRCTCTDFLSDEERLGNNGERKCQG